MPSKWQKSRAKNIDEVRRKDRERKAKARLFRENLLSQFPCLLCGEQDSDLIQWHHVVPEEKSFGIVQGNSLSHEAWWNEVLKCIPVCPTCHVKIHKEKLCLIPLNLLGYKLRPATENTCVPDSTYQASQQS